MAKPKTSPKITHGVTGLRGGGSLPSMYAATARNLAPAKNSAGIATMPTTDQVPIEKEIKVTSICSGIVRDAVIGASASNLTQRGQERRASVRNRLMHTIGAQSVWCRRTRPLRAHSSPPHACPLNAPLFLRPCGGAETWPSMARWRLWRGVPALRNPARRRVPESLIRWPAAWPCSGHFWICPSETGNRVTAAARCGQRPTAAMHSGITSTGNFG